MNEIDKLIHLYKSSRDYKERERYHAVLLVKTGNKINFIAKLFFVDEETVSQWIKKWDEEKGVKNEDKSGRPPKLTKQQEEEICKLVDENNPQEHGYKTAVWDCVELEKFVFDTYGVGLSDEAIRRILKKNGFSYKKAEYLFTKRDLEKRNMFVEEILSLYESLENTKIMFCDEMSTKLHPKQGYIWTRDKKVFVQTNCEHKRINTIAAIDPLIGEKVVANYDKNNADSFVQFLEKLENSNKGNIILVLDNYPVHHSRKVKDYLEGTGRIVIKHLPTYSPDLNPIEWLWGYVRKKFLNCICPGTKDELRLVIDQSFNSISCEEVKRICNLDIIKKHRIT